MKLNKNITRQKWFAYTVATCSAVILYLLLTNLTYYMTWVGRALDILSPIITGVIVAYLLSPICGFFERLCEKKVENAKAARTLGVVITLLIVAAIITLLAITVIPQLFGSIAFLFSHLKEYLAHLEDVVDHLGALAIGMNIDLDSMVDKVEEFLNGIMASLPDQVDSVVSTSYQVGVSVTNFFLGIFIAIYLLMDEKKMTAGVKRLLRAILKTKDYHNLAMFWNKCNSIMLRYLGLDIADGAIIGLINFVFMLIARMPYAVLISVVVGLTNLAPTFGPIVGGVIGAFILVLVEPWYALAFVIFTGLLQTLDGYVIKPKLFGSSLGVPPVWILISIIIGGKLFGVVGILLAIPFASIISFIYDDVVDKKIEERRAIQVEKGKEMQDAFLAKEAARLEERDKQHLEEKAGAKKGKKKKDA